MKEDNDELKPTPQGQSDVLRGVNAQDELERYEASQQTAEPVDDEDEEQDDSESDEE